jgi:hypothetical protein
MVNEHEIEFADQTADRGFETSHMIDKYLEKTLRVSVAYANAIKVANGKSWTMKFRVGDWFVRMVDSRDRFSGVDAHSFLLKYKKTTLVFFNWVMQKKGSEKSVLISDTQLAKEHLFYLAEYIKHVDVELTQINTMMERVQL